MIIPITCYRCSECNRIYETDPERCVCDRAIFIKNSVHGSFIILSKSERMHHYMVKCILCGSTKELHYANIKRQASCGCKPRHIDLTEVTPNKVMFVCKKCDEAYVSVPPIVSYCCED